MAGYPGAGKTTIGATFLYCGALKGEPGIYVSFIEKRSEFIRHMKSLGMNFEELEKKGLFEFIEVPTLVSKDFLDELVELLGNRIFELNAKRVVIDSITSLIGVIGKEEARAFLHTTLFKLTKPRDIVTYLIAELPIGSKIIGYGFEEFLGDVVIKLVTEKVVGLLRRKMILHKVREAPIMYQEYEFTIGKGGIRVYTKVPRKMTGSYSLERISSGINELDNMLGGGFLKGSSVLISGSSGSGKTLLLLTLALHNASKGKKVLYITFEESEEQLETNAKSLGYSVNELKSKGLLQIVSIGPGIFTPETLYYTLIDLIESYSPDILIADGLTALSRLYGVQEFVFLGRNIITICKNRGITSFFTMLSDVIKEERSEVSTLTDAIVALWLERKEDKIERKITVVKSRGSWHDTRVRIIELEKGEVIIK